LIKNCNIALSFAPIFKSGFIKKNEKPGSFTPLKKERMLHEPHNEWLIKSELMAKAGICLKIVFTSLKAGADFKKCRQN